MLVYVYMAADVMRDNIEVCSKVGSWHWSHLSLLISGICKVNLQVFHPAHWGFHFLSDIPAIHVKIIGIA